MLLCIFSHARSMQFEYLEISMKITLLVIVAITLCIPAVQSQVLLPWTVEQVLPNATWPTLHLGAGSKVVFDKSTGLPIVAGLDSDSNTGALSFARYTSIGGFYWQLFNPSITTAPDIDLDYWESSTEWKIGVSYRDLSDGSMRFVEYRYVKATQQGSFLHHKILDTTFGNDGIDSSFKYDYQGHAHIAAYTFGLVGTDSLQYAYWVGSGGNCGFDTSVGEWQCSVVDTGETVGREPSLTLDDYNYPHIGYIKPYGTDTVFVASATGGTSGNCGSGSSAGRWNCVYVDYALGTYMQSNPSVFFDRSAPSFTGLHVAWDSEYPPTGEKTLNHAIWAGGGAGDCGINQEWSCEYVASTGTSDGDVALAVNGRGLPLIAYRDSASNLLMLAEDTGSVWAGNCGPTDRWQCDILGTDATSDTLGEWIDIDVDRNGVPIVAYSHYVETQYDYNLMLTYPWILRDSFESGDLSAWSSYSARK